MGSWVSQRFCQSVREWVSECLGADEVRPGQLTSVLTLSLSLWLEYWSEAAAADAENSDSGDRRCTRAVVRVCLFTGYCCSVPEWGNSGCREETAVTRRKQNRQKIIDFFHEQTANEIKERTHLKSHMPQRAQRTSHARRVRARLREGERERE